MALVDVGPELDSPGTPLKITIAFGTRPEAIKLAPVIRELRGRANVCVRVVSTSQHREMVAQVLRVFDVKPDIDLDVMQPRQRLAELSSRIMTAIDQILIDDRPDVLLVQGDTTSALMCGLVAFYRHVPVAHVEAGLRTDSPDTPFPEEMNRRLISTLGTWHFAPTERARRALIAERVPQSRVFVTGNTIVDALLHIRSTEAFRAVRSPVQAAAGERLILVTLHRRESWGAPLDGMCRALRAIADRRPDVRIVWPVHPNPTVRDAVRAALGSHSRIDVIEATDYLSFIALMDASWIVITDSGGVQEEAPVLGRPVLVLRDSTERPEAIEEGVARLVGADPEAIVHHVLDLIDDPRKRDHMARRVSPFGDGRAAIRIADVLTDQCASFPN